VAILFAIYLLFGLFYANSKINNPVVTQRPQWAIDESLPFFLRSLGFIFFALCWPIIMITSR
jgi:hypothetical protein